MLISIIIPTYNYGHVVERAIQSVLLQQDPHIQIVIINDGSTDNTAEIIKPYIKKSSNISYIYQENRGLAATRNTGIKIAAGDYLLFLDADDELLPGALANFHQFIKQHQDADVIAAGHVSIMENGKQRTHDFRPLSSNRLKNFSGYIRKKYALSNGATLFHRRVFQKLIYPEHLRSNEDIAVFAQALALFNCMSFSQPVLAVHKHADSMRNQINVNRNVGLKVVDAVFDAKLLPAVFMQFRQEFYAQRCLSLFRSLYLAREYAEARSFYKQAILAYPSIIFYPSYLKKFIFSFFH